jgi:alkylation response protein AidB-like acyl-CoA dehydrogenase
MTPEQHTLQDTVRRFASTELPSLARELEVRDEPVPAAWMKRYAELGVLGINVPEVYGGQGLGHFEAVLALEEFAKISSAVAMPVFEDLKQRLLPRVCRGELVIAVSMSEPEAGTALTDLKTRAQARGDGFVLNGTKRWCSGAGHAEGYLVYARLSGALGAAGIGAVYVEKGTPGLRFGAREELMGFRGIMTADIFFDDVAVARENVVLPAGSFKKLMEAFDLERCGNTTMSIGIAAGALADAAAYVQERRQFGKPLIEFQAVQIKLAEMAIKVQAARLLLHHAIAGAGDGLPSMLDSSMAKCFANETVREVAGTAMQLLGGYGYSKAFDVERRLRDAWGWGIAGGTIDVQKINIASAIVGRRFDQRR